jgi:hypothetical protein
MTAVLRRNGIAQVALIWWSLRLFCGTPFISSARSGASSTRAPSRRWLTQACGAGRLEPHQPHRGLFLAPEQTRRKGRVPALRLPLQPSELYFPFRQTSPYVRDGTLVGRSHDFPYQGAVLRGFDHEICYIGT